jgi:hypothetical protein
MHTGLAALVAPAGPAVSEVEAEEARPQDAAVAPPPGTQPQRFRPIRSTGRRRPARTAGITARRLTGSCRCETG